MSHNCSVILSKYLVVKKEDPSAFTIPCTIGAYKFNKALCDLCANINLMPLSIFEESGLETPLTTIVDWSIKRPEGILHDVLMKVEKLILSANFVIIDCEVDTDMLIILGRPLLSIRRAIVRVQHF